MNTCQQPIVSPFSAASTAAEVMADIDLQGRLAVVTGGYSGLGLVITTYLTKAGARVIVPARDPERAEVALTHLANVSVLPMDLMNADSVQNFCNLVVAENQSLTLLINCAGVMATSLARDADGHESQFAINHLGHFRLVCGLWPLLAAASGARVIALSSRGHHIAGIDFDDIDFNHRAYDKWVAYGQSKTANALFAMGVDSRGCQKGVRAFSVHPGQILTDLTRHLSASEIASFDVMDENGQQKINPEAGLKTLGQGASTALWCATSEALAGKGGVYCEDCNIARIYSPNAGRKGVAAWAADPEKAEKLWALSVQWTGLDV